jgi:hypothetical protein
MKKITLVFLAIFALSRPAFSQAVISVEAPLYNGDWAALIGPNGFASPVASPTLTYAYNNACFLITQAELSRMITTNSVVTGFGFAYYRPASTPVSGQFTLYLQNTTDVTYNKGLNFASLLSGMSTNYSGNLTLPGSAAQATAAVSVALGTNFNYTGGGIYVAYSWYTPTTNSSAYSRYLSNNSGTVTLGAYASAPSAGPAPTTLTLDIRRPSIRLTTSNTATNEVGVVSIKAPGLVSKVVNPADDISAVIKNNGINAISNVAVTLSVSGANTFNNTQIVPIIPAGATALVTFSPQVSLTNGLNNMTLTVPPDQYNLNNGVVWTQSVNCTDFGSHPPFAATAFMDGSYGYGNPAIIATPYTPPTTTSITAIKFAASQSASGSICGVLTDGTGAIIATTNTVVLSTASFGVYTNLKFTPAQELTGGSTYYYGVAQLTGATFPFGTADVLATTNLNLYFNVPIAGGSIGGAQNQMGYLGLQAVLGFSNTTIIASASRTILCKGEIPGTVTLTASGPSTFTWAPGGTGNSIVVTPTVFATSGLVNYIVNGTDSPSGCRASQVAISVSVSACTGLSSNYFNNSEIVMYPNPSVNGRTNLTGLVGYNVISVYNILGQIISTTRTESESIEIDLSSQSNGTYLVKITDAKNDSKTVKTINQN